MTLRHETECKHARWKRIPDWWRLNSYIFLIITDYFVWSWYGSPQLSLSSNSRLMNKSQSTFFLLLLFLLATSNLFWRLLDQYPQETLQPQQPQNHHNFLLHHHIHTLFNLSSHLFLICLRTHYVHVMPWWTFWFFYTNCYNNISHLFIPSLFPLKCGLNINSW